MESEITDAMVEAAAKAFAEATGYYVEFHRGLSSPSADKIRDGARAALSASLSVQEAGAVGVKAIPDLHDFVTHRRAWRQALEMALAASDSEQVDGYWHHELTAFDRAFDIIAALASPPPEQEAGAEPGLIAEIDNLAKMVGCRFVPNDPSLGRRGEWEALTSEIDKIDADFPNYASWTIELPAGHWRALRSAAPYLGAEGAAHWRNDALEKAAQIVERYGADPQIARDIRAMLAASPSHPENGR